ncbi:MAG: TolC family protein [Synechococcaceae cyanobacterium]|nr:TolC family protein [Synechococcaceae cyanobacterium]
MSQRRGSANSSPNSQTPVPNGAVPAPTAAPGVGSYPASVSPSGQPSKGSPQLTAGDPVRQVLPLAPKVKGERPKANPRVLAPAATKPPLGDELLLAPNPLALPVKPAQVRIMELRPLGLREAVTLAEVNNPNLKAVSSLVDQAQSRLRAEIALWYPQVALNAGSFPAYADGAAYSSRALTNNSAWSSFVGNLFNSSSPLQQFPYSISSTPPPFQVPAFSPQGDLSFQRAGYSATSVWRMSTNLEVSWALIDPARTPRIAAARDDLEDRKNSYLIALRDLRLQVAQTYFDLQRADEKVQVGQESVRASLVSLRDARARFQAGVATKLEVLEAETQLARNQQQTTDALRDQSIARRAIAQLLSLPQDVTPTAKEPARVIGTWQPSLQESIVAAYAFREELDQLLLKISRANSLANASLAAIQPVLRIVNSVNYAKTNGYEVASQPDASDFGWGLDNTIGLRLSWTLFDGGRASAQYREQKQAAQQNRFLFAQQRDRIRFEVEQSFYQMEAANRNITTTARQVLSASESLRLARLRFQAGVTTQREVVDNQRDLTQAQVFYTDAIASYNSSLAELSRRTGLDQVVFCKQPQLPAKKPSIEGMGDVPIEPTPLAPACKAQSRSALGYLDLGAPTAAPAAEVASPPAGSPAPVR